jgi:hypothetical protein
MNKKFFFLCSAQHKKNNYRFIVDGQWCDDPECSVRAPNPYGGQNMVRQVA